MERSEDIYRLIFINHYITVHYILFLIITNKKGEAELPKWLFRIQNHSKKWDEGGLKWTQSV